VPLFGSKKPGSRKRPSRHALALRIEPFRGLPDIPVWRSALASGDWVSVDAGLAAVTDPERRELVVDRLVDGLERGPALDEWADSDRSAQGLLVRGAHSIRWAWEARGNGRAAQVEKSAWNIWFERLRSAETDLVNAAKLAPDDPTPWGRLVISARALEISQAERWSRYRRATALAPFLSITADEMLQGLCKKWSGSHDAMFAFATETSEAAPIGHPIHRVVAMAIIERRSACESLAAWRQLRAESPKFERILNAAAAQSVDLDSFGVSEDPDPQYLLTRNVFACAFAQMNHLNRLRMELETIGPNITEWPWRMWGDPEAEVRRVRGVVNLD
jgi:hypothetical protein